MKLRRGRMYSIFCNEGGKFLELNVFAVVNCLSVCSSGRSSCFYVTLHYLHDETSGPCTRSVVTRLPAG